MIRRWAVGIVLVITIISVIAAVLPWLILSPTRIGQRLALRIGHTLGWLYDRAEAKA
jgi:hypothetical protein